MRSSTDYWLLLFTVFSVNKMLEYFENQFCWFVGAQCGWKTFNGRTCAESLQSICTKTVDCVQIILKTVNSTTLMTGIDFCLMLCRLCSVFLISHRDCSQASKFSSAVRFALPLHRRSKNCRMVINVAYINVHTFAISIVGSAFCCSWWMLWLHVK